MIEEEEDASVVSLEDEQALPTLAFAQDEGLPDALRRQVVALAQAQRLGDTSKLLFKMARAEPPDRQIRILVTFISHVVVSKDDARPMAEVMAQLAPLLSSDALPWHERQAMLDRVLCHLDRLIRGLAALQASATATKLLRKTRSRLAEQSANAELFEALAKAPTHQILKRALGHGDKFLGAALVCMQPLSAAHYAQLMADSAATSLRRTAWIDELRRLHQADAGSFLKVATALVTSPTGLSECALLHASIHYTDDQDAFEAAMRSALQSAMKTTPPAFAIEDLLFSLRTLGKLHHLLDCAERGQQVALPACLSGRWVFQAGRITHRKLLLALRAELDRALRHADEETCRLWRTARQWLKRLDPAPDLSTTPGARDDRWLPTSAFLSFAIEPTLWQKVVELSTSTPCDTVEKDLSALFLSIQGLDDRLQAMAAFVCIADVDAVGAIGAIGLRPIVAALSKITPLLESSDVRSWVKQDVLDALLCALVRLMRRPHRLQGDAMYFDTLQLLFRRWRKCSPHSKLFKHMAGLDTEKVLDHALHHQHLGLALACCERLSVSRYARFMVESGATHKRRAEWMHEIRRLCVTDLSSCLAIASWLAADAERLPECALVLACVPRAADRKAFDLAMSEALGSVRSASSQKDLVFSMKILAMLFAALDAAEKSNWDHCMVILGTYWHLSECRLTHRGRVSKLVVQLDVLMPEAPPETTKFWGIVKAWLLKLEAADKSGDPH